jgi:hypothetical protein
VDGCRPRVIFRCHFCTAQPDAETQRSLERQLRELVFGEYLEALPGDGWCGTAAGPSAHAHACPITAAS